MILLIMVFSNSEEDPPTMICICLSFQCVVYVLLYLKVESRKRVALG